MADAPLTAPVEALDVFADLLAGAEAGPSANFYSRMSEATCRLASMRRALVFVYDEERREVVAAGAHGMDLAMFEDASVDARTAPIAFRALSEDRVVEASEHFEAELPEEFLPLVSAGTLTCTPMSAGGRWYGVILADRPADAGPLTDAQRYTLWSLGKVAGLAVQARRATRAHDTALELSARIDLAREVHEAVIQRLFGVSLALSGEGPLAPEVRARSREELQAALGELRAALQRPLARRSRATGTTLQRELSRLRRMHRDVAIHLVEGADVTVPADLEPLAQSVLREAVRNALKHADPSRIDVTLSVPDSTFVLEVLNDGVGGSAVRKVRQAASGMGLRLAAFEALEQGGLVEFGPAGDGRWRVRLAVPLEEEA